MKKMEAQSRTGPVAGQPHASVQKTGTPVKPKSPCRRFRFLFRVVGRPARRHPFSLHFLLGVVINIILFTPAILPAQQQKWDGNRTTPVHLIPLKDELDQPIIPTETNPLPFSSRYTWAPCPVSETVRKA